MLFDHLRCSSALPRAPQGSPPHLPIPKPGNAAGTEQRAPHLSGHHHIYPFPIPHGKIRSNLSAAAPPQGRLPPNEDNSSITVLISDIPSTMGRAFYLFYKTKSPTLQKSHEELLAQPRAQPAAPRSRVSVVTKLLSAAASATLQWGQRKWL